MVEEQVYQCAKVARPSPSQEIMEENGNETHPIKINSTTTSTPTPASTQQEPTKEEGEEEEEEQTPQTHSDMKDNIIGALRGFMSMGMYMCGRQDPEQNEESEQQDSQSLEPTESFDELHLQEEKSSSVEESKIDSISVDDYIFEDTSIDEDHNIAPTVTMHRYYVRTQLGPIAEEEQKEQEPSSSSTRMNGDISDNETEPSSNVKSLCYEEECKEEQESHGFDSIDLHMMGDFDLFETNFFGSKGKWNEVPGLLSPTRFEI